jgi:hypothetical protein
VNSFECSGSSRASTGCAANDDICTILREHLSGTGSRRRTISYCINLRRMTIRLRTARLRDRGANEDRHGHGRGYGTRIRHGHATDTATDKRTGAESVRSDTRAGWARLTAR